MARILVSSTKSTIAVLVDRASAMTAPQSAYQCQNEAGVKTQLECVMNAQRSMNLSTMLSENNKI